MTSFIASLWNRFCWKQEPLTIITVGLDNSGKTSLLTRIKSASSSSRQTSSSSADSSKFSGTKSLGPSMSGVQPAVPINPLPSNNEEPISTEAADFSSAAQPGSWLSGLNRERENVAPTIGYNYDKIQYKGHTINIIDFSGQSKYRSLWQEFYNCADAIVFVLDSSDLIRLVVARDELENILSHPYFNSLQEAASNLTGATDSKMTFQMAQKQLVISQGKLLQSPLEADEGSKATRIGQIKEYPTGGGPRSCGRRTRIPILFLANKADLSNSADTELIARTLNLAELPQSRHPWHIQATSVQTSQGIQEAFDWLLEELSRQADGNQAAL